MKCVIPILILILIFISPVSALKYYAYGDSMTAYYPNYIKQLQARYDPLASVNWNTDGSGKTSTWGVEHMGEHPYGIVPQYTFIAFGFNDKVINSSFTSEETAANMITMYNFYKNNGSIPYILIQPVSNKTSYRIKDIAIIQNILTKNNISFIKMYDAVDLIPYNGNPEVSNPMYVPDTIHPNTAGHSLIADYIWKNTRIGQTPIGS